MLKELLPRLQRIAVLWQTENPYNRAIRSQFERICQSLGLETIFVGYAALGEIGRAIAQLAVKRRAQALVLSSDEFLSNHRSEIVDAATKNGSLTMAEEPAIVREAGALVAYSPTLIDQYRIRAEYIDRILRGAKPADLPVQQPTKFELVINLKTAKALGLTIPQSLLLRADEVIQ
jgi:putative ABC transport system substrate-binding protein